MRTSNNFYYPNVKCLLLALIKRSTDAVASVQYVAVRWNATNVILQTKTLQDRSRVICQGGGYGEFMRSLKTYVAL